MERRIYKIQVDLSYIYLNNDILTIFLFIFNLLFQSLSPILFEYCLN